MKLLMSSISKRVTREWKNIKKEEVDLAKDGIFFEQVGDKMNDIKILLNGAKDTPYEGGRFELKMFLKKDYPMEPPLVFFNTPIYHPNVDKAGKICLDILKDKWTPAINIVKVIYSIVALLSEPNVDDPYNNEAADLWKRDIKKAHKKVKSYVNKFAMPKSPPSPTLV